LFFIYEVSYISAIGMIALDTRLGCLEPNLAKDSEAQRMIDAVINVFSLVFELDFKVPIWKLFPTPALKKFIKYQHDIMELV